MATDRRRLATTHRARDARQGERNRRETPRIERLEDRLAPAVALDFGFGIGGRGYAPLEASRSLSALDAVVQPDGLFVTVGTIDAGGSSSLVVTRSRPDGAFDPTFSVDGQAVVALPGVSNLKVSAVTLQDDGKIVVAGSTQGAAGNTDFLVARLNGDGTLDSTFGAGGRAIINFAAGAFGNDSAADVAVQDDGRIVVVGAVDTTVGSSFQTSFGAARLTAGGVVDPTFAGDGTGVFAFPGQGVSNEALSVVLQPDGQAVVVGTVEFAATDRDFGVLRLTTDGTLDPTFSGDGRATIDFGLNAGGADRDIADSVALLPDGRVVVAGSVLRSGAPGDGNFDFGLARLRADGAIDTNFGPSGDGRATLGFDLGGGLADFVDDLLVLPGGKLVVGGLVLQSGSTGGGNFDYGVARLDANGLPDPSFGDDGRAVAAFDLGGTNIDDLNALALGEGGNVIAIGTVQGVDGFQSQGLAQFDTAGELDADFGVGGRQVRNLVLGLGTIDAALVLPDGRTLLAGSVDRGGGDTDFAVARLLADGTPDPAFGASGLVVVPINLLGGTADRARAIAVQTNGKIVVAGEASNESGGTNLDIAVVRLDADGTLDNSFSGDGIATFGFNNAGSSRDDDAFAVIVRDDGTIVVAGSAGVAGGRALALIGLTSAGALNPDFSDDGLMTLDPAVHGFGSFRALARSGTSIVGVGGVSATAGGSTNFGVFRLLADGTPDASFDGDGRAVVDFGPASTALALTISGGQVLVAGRAGTADNGDFAVARLDADGTLDDTFSGDGRTLIDIDGRGSEDDAATGIVVQADGRIVLGGTAERSGADTDFALARLTSGGAPDASFAPGGGATIFLGFNLGGTNADASVGLGLLSGGEIQIAGSAAAAFPTGGTVGAVARLNEPTTPLTIDDVVNVAPDPRADPVTSIDVVFSRDIDLSTFDVADLSLTRDNALVALSGIIISQIGDATYRILGLAAETTAPGSYEFSVDATGVSDLAGNNGTGSASDTFVVLADSGPTVVQLGPVVPNLRNTAVPSIDVVFSEAISLATFTAADVTLTRNGQPVSLSGVTTSSVGGATYRIGGLEAATAAGGNYEITVSAASIADTSGNIGTGSISTTFVVDVTAPTILDVGPVTPDPRNTPVSSLDVTFSEPLADVSFTRADLSLTRGGQDVALDDTVTVALISGATYRISGLESFTDETGAYVLTVNGAGLADAAGNAATGSESDAFAVDRTGPTITAVGEPTPDPSTGPVRSVDVTFSEAIDGGSFTAADLTLTRNGFDVPLGAGVTTALVSGTTYRVSGLGPLTASGGAYVLTVNAGAVNDALGNAGSGSDTVDFRRGIVPADYDGDGQTDLATYEYDPTRDVGIFRIRPSGGSADRTVEIPQAGANSVPVPGDYDGDGQADPALVDPLARLNGSAEPNASVWIIRRSKFEGQASQTLRIPFGAAGVLDRPSPADFDGDGRTDIATFRADSDITPGAAQWFILPSSPNPNFDTIQGAFTVVFGAPGGVDLPAAFDFDGDGKADIATFRPVSDLVPGAAQWFVLPSGPNGVNFETKIGGFPVTFGAAGNADQPGVADWDGDGADDITAFRSESDLVAGSSQWFILPTRPNQPNYSSNSGGFPVTFGQAGEIAAVGDYTDDGRPDLALFNAETGTWRIRSGTDGPELAAVTFGGTGSRVVPVISPLFFRLRATDNIGASGGARLAAFRSLASTGVDRGTARLAAFAASQGSSSVATSTTPKDANGRWADLFDEALDALGQ